MFDRIAGVYDLMNSVMTAGLHHRWRERAADLARVGPGRPRARRGHGTGDLAIELRAASAPGRGRRLGLLGGMLERRAQGAGAALRAGQRARRCPTPTTSSTPRPSASARATSPTSSAGCARWRASCARAGASSCSRSRRRSGRRCRRSSRLWFDRVVPLLGRFAGDPRPTRTCRARCALPGPRGAGAAMMRARRAARRALDPHRGRDHRDPRHVGTVA
jgi:demethylmenaquinone methyltransferase/2-methoxy-6-polyprenyl-1,4-benzoquinol methylase